MALSKGIMHNLEHDCTLLCKSIDHGCQITSALTKRAVTDEQLAAYLNWICTNCGEVNDKEGRTALHLVASCGRLKLMKYLIHVHGANLNFTDQESGCTPLHRAVFYGQIHIAVNLMKLGCDLGIFDNGHLTAIDYAVRDRYPPQTLNNVYGGEVYAWGSNDNYTLGIGNEQARSYPDLLDIFRKGDIFIKQVSLSKFHTIFLTGSGQVYTCGHGQGGRLGNGSENTVLSPQLIDFISHGIAQEPCVGISAGCDHSLFVMESGIVWSCGLNKFSQLGHADGMKAVLSPKPLKAKLSSVQNVCAARSHSVAWGSKAVFTWGRNSGQLGHDKTTGEYINLPKKVMGLGNSEITSVASSDGATVIATSSGHIYVLHEFQCRKISSKRNNIASISVIGGHSSPNDSSQMPEENNDNQLRILVLTSDGLLFLWTESFPHLIRCIYSLKRPLSIRSMCVSFQSIYLITDLGEAFKGKFKQFKSKRDSTSNNSPTIDMKKSSFTKFLNKQECVMIKVQRIPNIYRAISVVCDVKDKNCAIIQAYPTQGIAFKPTLSPSILQSQMYDLLENASQEDTLHDITFKVEGQTFPAHKYVVFESERIRKICDENSNKTDLVEINDISSNMFKQLLKFMYTGTCDLLKVGTCHVNFLSSTTDNSIQEMINNFGDVDFNDKQANDKNIKSKSKLKVDKNCEATKDPIRQLQYNAKQFGLSELYSVLSYYRFENGVIYYTTKNDNNKHKPYTRKFQRLSHPELLDAVIKPTGDGSKIKVHRCILVARLDYFHGMFMHAWRENVECTEIKLPYPHSILKIVIDFLYSDDWSDKDACNDIDFICQLLIVADQLFITRLREMCEIVLVKHITIKNVATFLQFATVYNAMQLHKCCVEYICLNLAPLLENHYLEFLPDETLVELTEKYLLSNKYMSSRVVTPYSNAPSDDVINDIYEKFYVDVDDLSENNKKKQTFRRKTLPRRISDSEKGRIRNESTSENFVFGSPKAANGILHKISNVSDDSIHNNTNFEKDQSSANVTKSGNNEVQVTEEKCTTEMTIVQSRLKAIALSKNVIVDECFEQIIKQSKDNNDKHFPVLGKKSIQKHESPVIKNSFDNIDTPKKSPFIKISQKQRKKQFAQSIADELDKVNIKSETYVPASVWDMRITNNDSFADILKSEQQSPPKHDIALDLPRNNNILTQLNSVNNTSPIGSPKNTHSNDTNVTFSDILADERQQRENYSKMISKPLILTQIEDRAIEDLEKFYNIDAIEDEVITIARVCTVYSSPLWIKK